MRRALTLPHMEMGKNRGQVLQAGLHTHRDEVLFEEEKMFMSNIVRAASSVTRAHASPFSVVSDK